MPSIDPQLPRRQRTRRGFLLGFTALTGGLALSVACGQPAAPAKPAETKPAESKPAAAAPTTAPAAAKPAESKPAAAAPAAKPAEAAKPAASGEPPKKGGTMRVGLYVEAATMDPHLSGSKIDRQVYHNIFDPLVVLDTRLNIKPGLAESWTQPDPKTIVFKLRQGVKFHDGTDFNAEAVKFNFDRMQNPETKSVRTGEIASVDKAEVVDTYTVKLNLKKPDAALLAALTDRAGMMISPEAVKKFGADLQRNPVGTGPFQFVEWVKDDHLSLKRFDGYWNKEGGPYLDGVRYRPIPDDTVKTQSLIGGEIDVMDYVAPRDVAMLKGNASVVEVDVESLATFNYVFNTTKPPFDKKELRQAVAYAIDTEAIVKGVWLGVGVPSNGPIAPSSWAYDSAIKPIKRDIARAKELLAAGGMPTGFTFKVTTNNIPINVQEAEAIKAQLAEAGITMDVNLVDSARLQADGNSKNFDMVSYQWSGRPDPDGNTYQFFRTQQGSGLNWAGYTNPKADELMDKSREVSDQAERKKLFSDLVKLLQDDLPWLFILHPIEPKAFSPKVQGYDPIPDGMIRFKDMWLK
jgi:peptide/nickel transport system substrate-binding protein